MYLVFNVNAVEQSGRIADIFKNMLFISSVFLIAAFISKTEYKGTAEDNIHEIKSRPL